MKVLIADQFSQEGIHTMQDKGLDVKVNAALNGESLKMEMT